MATTLRLNAEAQAALDALVADERVSANEIIQRAIVDRAARRGLAAEVRAAFADGEQEWGDVLERLRLA